MRQSQWSIRVLLYLLTVAVILPVAALLVYSGYRQYERDRHEASAVSENLARLAADNVRNFLADTEQVLANVAARPQVRAMQGAPCDGIFENFRDLYPQFGNLSLASLQGELICSAMAPPGNGRMQVGHLPWFQQVLKEKRRIVGAPSRGAASGRMVVVATQPVLDTAGTMVGALQVAVDLEKLRVVAFAGQLPPTTVISIINTQGVLVTRSLEPQKWIGVNLRGTPIVETVLKERSGTTVSINTEGVERVFGFVPVPSTDWYAVAGISTEVAFQGARQEALTNTLGGAAIIAGALLLAFFLSQRIAEPVLRMREAAQRVAGGDLHARIPASGPAEVVEVASQFNAMLDAIEDSRQRLTRAHATLQLLSLCVARLNDVVMITDATPPDQGGPFILFVNEAFERITGYGAQEVQGRSPKMLQGPATARAELDRIRAAVVAAQPVRAELVNYTRDGNPFWLELDITPVRDSTGTVTNWVSVERNISERKRDEAEIERTSRALRMISRCDEALVRAESETALLGEVCRIAAEVGGYRVAWVGYAQDDPERSIAVQAYAGVDLGYFEEVTLSWSEATPAGRGAAGRTIRGGEPVVVPDFASDPAMAPWHGPAAARGYRGAVCLPLRDDQRVFGLLGLYSAEVCETPAEELTLLRELARDLAFGIGALRARAGREAARQEVLRLNSELEERVRRRTAQLEAANKEMESFSYTVSHDLRAPLRAMHGFAQLLRLEYGAQLPAEGVRFLESITNSATQMGKLIDSLLALSGLARQEMKRRKFDTALLVHDAVATARETHPTLPTVVDIGALPPAFGDPVLLRQVWVNLIANAFKYSSTQAQPLVEVGSTQVDGHTVYFVRDNGVGFDARYADKLFGAFQRLHAEKEFAGTGIGLAIVRRIVERHGGRIWAAGEVGQGATFSFTLGREEIEVSGGRAEEPVTELQK